MVSESMNRPDDTEANQAILEADSFSEALWEIAEKYEINLTNNYERWQDGVWLREIGEFIQDVNDARLRFYPEEN